MFAHSRDPHPAIKLWCQVPFTKSITTFQIEMYCMQCFLKSKYIKSRTFNDKNRWVIKKVMVFKKLLQHLATRGTYSPGDWRCDEAWREQTLVYPPAMCQQRLIYCTWKLNVMCTLYYYILALSANGSRSLFKRTFYTDRLRSLLILMTRMSFKHVIELNFNVLLIFDCYSILTDYYL